MALDSLDFGVIVVLALAVAAYFGKDFIFTKKVDEGGFLSNEGGSNERDIVEYLKKKNKNCVIFYGSQTGTAEDYSSKLSKELSARFGLKTMTADLGDYDYENLDKIDESVLCFFILATYGEGEPTDNAVEFYDWLQNEADTLSTMKYAVFGLGNSTYEFYNKIGKDVHQFLEDKGADNFAEYGEGDDGVGSLDEDFLAWKDQVFESLKSNLNMEEHELIYEPGLKLIECDDITKEDTSVSHGEPDKSYINSTSDLTKGPFGHTHPYLAPIVFSKELFQSKERSCIQAQFDISDCNLRYTTGDHVAVWPSNSNENIDTFVKAFGLSDKLNTVFNLKALDSTITIPFPTPITYEAVVRHHLEISGPVSRQSLLSIIAFAPDADSKALVTKLAGDKALFADQVTQKKLNLADALLYISNGQPWTKVPFEFIIENVPHLQARYYSISSSSLTEKTKIEVTAVVEFDKEDDRLITGVVTNLLSNIQIDQNKESKKPIVTYDLKGPRGKFSSYKLPIHVRRSTFKLPSNPSTPIIMIGPGTGVAPFRGFIRDRIAQKKLGQTPGESLLFYGCRKENEDFLYKNEWSEYAKTLGSSFEMFTAFSRENATKKVYVQDKLLEHSKKLNELIEAGAFIYVCGDASRMARDVQAALAKIISKERNIAEEKGVELIRSFKVQNRYQEDVW
jgi:NADPH-ferrihemoprotein reductase